MAFNFRNKVTDETLSHRQHGYCPTCGANFSSWAAFDEHRYGPHSPEGAASPVGMKRICLEPAEVGLSRSINKHGAVVWS